MLKENIILKIVTCLLLPYIIIFALYVQIFGEVAPGGGFQAGAIAASALIAYDLLYASEKEHLIDQLILIRIAAFGVFIYASVGLVSYVYDLSYLNYFALPGDNPQALGIMLVELGVGIAVTTVLFLIYQEFKVRNKNE